MASKNSSSSSSSSSETSLFVNAAIVGRLLMVMLSLGSSKVGLEVSIVASFSSASLSSVILGVLLVLLSSASLKARFVLFLLSSLSPILVSSSSCSWATRAMLSSHSLLTFCSRSRRYCQNASWSLLIRNKSMTKPFKLPTAVS